MSRARRCWSPKRFHTPTLADLIGGQRDGQAFHVVYRTLAVFVGLGAWIASRVPPAHPETGLPNRRRGEG
jgi:hypothetical protein